MAEAGWYPQPDGSERYWDGTRWTEDVRAPERPGPSPYGQAPYGQAPPQSDFPWKWVLIVVAVVVLLCCGGFAACTAGTIANIDEINKEFQSLESETGGSGDGVEITEGEAFEVRGFRYAAGWEVNQDMGLLAIRGLRVTNGRGSVQPALVDIELERGSEVLATANCVSDPIPPGGTGMLSCISSDELPSDYDRIVVRETLAPDGSGVPQAQSASTSPRS